MRFLFYTHSLVSDWNHGNAHFLRGVMRELIAAGHGAAALEPEDGWSRSNLVTDQGEGAVVRFPHDFPGLASRTYGDRFDHEAAVSEADVVIVHEWTAPEIVALLGRLRRMGGRFLLLFHDTHHRAVSDASAIGSLALEDYDAVLAFGEVLRERYLAAGWGRSAFTWHEAADTRLFRPMSGEVREGDLVWIGNWGDGERSRELATYLIEPVRTLRLAATVRGVRYPPEALAALADAGIRYGGWIANADAPALFARHRLTVHIPRGPYVQSLRGIPTIRVFEALAAGIPLISAPWDDAEGLFRPGQDFLMVRSGQEMQDAMARVLADRELASALAASGLATIRNRHSCAHRAEELLGIVARLQGARTPVASLRPEAAA